MEQKLKKKNKKRLLLFDLEQFSREEILTIVVEIKQRLLYFFKNHIGISNATNPSDIFEIVSGENPENMNMYKRSYWWKVIQNVMRMMRSSEELFIIHKGNSYFVLKTQDEAEIYKNILRRDIVNMEKAMERADKWVKEDKWRNLEKIW